jgi:2-amino-4-hydroxy-6-hydroxymethyldihydropteridine diphosphokinase
VALALGANLGASEENLRGAVARLREILGPLVVAPLYRTLPASPIPQPAFLNTAALGRTDLPADAVLAVAKRLELAAGRRLSSRHGPRPLDIDLLLWGDRLTDFPELTLPHPSLRSRRFVLAPLADIAPDLPLPPDGARVADLLAAVGQEDRVERVGWRLLPA